MKCEWVQENILLHIYNELPDDARYELEQHVARCPECAAELKRLGSSTLPSPSFRWMSRLRIWWPPRACVCRKLLKPPSRAGSGNAWCSTRAPGFAPSN